MHRSYPVWKIPIYPIVEMKIRMTCSLLLRTPLFRIISLLPNLTVPLDTFVTVIFDQILTMFRNLTSMGIPDHLQYFTRRGIDHHSKVRMALNTNILVSL